MQLTRSQTIVLIVLGVLTLIVYCILVGTVVVNSQQILQISAPAAATTPPSEVGAGEQMITSTATIAVASTPSPTPTIIPPTPTTAAPQTRHDLQVMNDPDNPSLRLQRGYVYIDLGAYAYAVEDFTTALELDSTLAEAYVGRGEAHFCLKEWSVALEDFEQALVLAPDMAEAHAWHGQMLFLRGEQEAASEALRQAVELDGASPVIHLWLADVLLNSGNPGEAKLEYTTALSLDAGYVDAYVGRAMAQAEIGEFDEAMTDLSTAQEIAPHNYIALNGQAWYYAWYRHANLEEAEQLALRAVNGAEDNLSQAACMDTLGWIYYQQGRYEEAVTTLEEAVELAIVEDTLVYPDIEQHLKKARAAQ